MPGFAVARNSPTSGQRRCFAVILSSQRLETLPHYARDMNSRVSVLILIFSPGARYSGT